MFDSFENDTEINQIRNRSSILGIPEDEFNVIYKECQNVIEKEVENKTNFQYFRTFLKISFFTFAVALIYHKYVSDKPYNLFVCNIQDYLYPILRFWRLMALPVLKLFPHISELYDETCLLENPFFSVKHLDCKPCKSVREVNVLMNGDYEPEISPPFLFKTDVEVGFEDLRQMYLNDRGIFDENAPKLLENGKKRLLLYDFFNSEDHLKGEEKHFIWRINRVLPAQLTRKLFSRPMVVPRTGQSIERFILINQPNAKEYRLPDTECNYVFVIQTKGERLYEMEPSKECQSQCKTVLVTLKENYLLWYNWWYWRPRSVPTDSNSTSMAYVGSFC